jgi:tetratricopeptide (TPR) repeat protein
MIGALLLAALLIKDGAAQPQPSSPCASAIKDADNKYVTGDFPAAISILKDCLSKTGATTQDKINAYKLLAKTYIAQGEAEAAEKSFEQMLQLDSAITLDPQKERREVIEIFNKVKIRFTPPRPQPGSESVPPPKQGSSKTKFLIAGGGVVAGGVVLYILLSGGAGGVFPNPPFRPTR